ncbi:MAG TPA: peptidoglycan-binding domain-containing protein [Thermohalobaculum sp.]|nr:peptidoglycan-binding domain-containing protein [Thermohalobaculum sp.]
MKYGLLSIVTLAGAVSSALLWSMSASDPYWRLVDTSSVPAPAYDGAGDLSAMLAYAPLDFGNTDAGAINPAADALADDSVAANALADAQDPHQGPELISRSAIGAPIAYEGPRVAVSAPAGLDLDSDAVITYAPVPGSPRARIVASEATEVAMELNRDRRVEVQHRLSLAGFSPNGIDGVFGVRTRGAITDFQAAWGFPATGYLEPSIYAELSERTEDAYQAFRQRAAATPRAPEPAPAAQEQQLASGEADGSCARDADGRIIERQSLACDIAGFGEQVVSYGRNTLEYDEDGTAAAVASFGATAGVDR